MFQNLSHSFVLNVRASSRVQTRGFAINPNEIAKRIVSTGNIQKITKSMKMVSAAKLRGDQKRLADGRPFGKAFDQIFQPKLGEEDKALPEYKKPLYVFISSDRGLCGGVNGSVGKVIKAAVEADVARGITPKVFIVGEKGSPLMQRQYGEYFAGAVMECWKTPMSFAKALSIAERISAVEDVDCVRIGYNYFVNSITYESEMKDVVNFAAIAGDEAGAGELPVPLNKYEIEYESNEEFFKNVYEYGLAVELYGCLLESATSEQSSRMTAMDNASKNAQEMVDKLTVQYNRARQARITTELIEIISGAESLKG